VNICCYGLTGEMMMVYNVLLLRCYAAQVPNADQAADEAINRNIDQLHHSLPSLQDRVLVLISDDRGFRAQLHKFLRAGGTGVLLVTARPPEQWDARGTAFSNVWQMSLDERVVFLDWVDILRAWQ
jgi:hypothetical protein